MSNKQANIFFDLDSNNKFTQCELLVVAENVVKATVPFNLKKGTFNANTDQYPWTTDMPVTGWDDSVDTLRIVFNIEHHPRKLSTYHFQAVAKININLDSVTWYVKFEIKQKTRVTDERNVGIVLRCTLLSSEHI